MVCIYSADYVLTGSILLCQGGTLASVAVEASEKAAVATVAAQNALLQLQWHAEDLRGAQPPAEVRDHVLDLMEHSWLQQWYDKDTNENTLGPFVRGRFEDGTTVGPWVLKNAHGIHQFEAIPAEGSHRAVYGTLLACNPWAGMLNPDPYPFVMQ